MILLIKTKALALILLNESTCLTLGDIVGLSYSSADSNVAELSSGIVTRVSETTVVVAFEEAFDSQSFDEDRLMRVTRLANDVTFKRMKRLIIN